MEPGPLLARCLALADAGGDATELLHEEVLYERVDGEVLRGRAAVLEALVSRGESEVRIVVRAVERSHCVLALQVPGLPGHLRLELHGEARDGKLFRLAMRG